MKILTTIWGIASKAMYTRFGPSEEAIVRMNKTNSIALAAESIAPDSIVSRRAEWYRLFIALGKSRLVRRASHLMTELINSTVSRSYRKSHQIRAARRIVAIMFVSRTHVRYVKANLQLNTRSEGVLNTCSYVHTISPTDVFRYTP